MALASIDDALTQYAANAVWEGSQAAATAALEAVRYLLVNRARTINASGTTDVSYESLMSEKAALEKFLGATAPRAFGRFRRTTAAPCQGGIA